MINLTPFTRAVRASSKQALKSSSEPMQRALGALVSRRLRKRSEQPRTQKFAPPAEQRAKPTRRRVRKGKLMRYKATSKVDVSRLGTYRHYLISTVRKHENTWDAENDHANCDNPKYAKNKLDFGWCAAEGYIEFV